MSIDKIVLADKLSEIHDHFQPRILAELNGQHMKLAKLLGEFIWHRHDDEDELFIIISGSLRMELRDKTLILGPGECVVIPRGVEHRPVADTEVSLLMFEPVGTLNTGNVRNERTVDRPAWA